MAPGCWPAEESHIVDGLTNATAGRLLGVSPATIGRLTHTFRLINEKDAKGRVIWREDVIRKAALIKQAIPGTERPVSVERLLEQAIRAVEG